MLKGEGDCGRILHLSGKCIQRGDQAQIIEIERAEGVGHRSQVLNRFLREILNFVQSSRHLFIFVFHLCQLHTLIERDQILDGFIVQFTCQMATFIFLTVCDGINISAQTVLRHLHLACQGNERCKGLCLKADEVEPGYALKILIEQNENPLNLPEV